jgi:hypothetical protein
VFFLAPSQEEQEQRVELLAKETINKKIQEKWEYQKWRCSECEKFLSSGVDLPP